MNPLDWTGPEFLLFYIPYGLAIVAFAWLAKTLYLARQSQDTFPTARWAPGVYPRETDAPAIAFLRGGPREAVRTVLSRLVGLGLVEIEERQMRLSLQDSSAAPLQPIELEAWKTLDRFKRSAADAEARVQAAVAPQLDEISRMLTDQGLLSGPAQKTALRKLLAVTWLAVGGLGLLKLVVALSRGRTNVGFLILLLIGFTLLIFRLLKLPRRLPAGDRYLAWVQEAHRGLAPKAQFDDLLENAGHFALAAAIFGVPAVPALASLNDAFEAERRRAAADGGSSCGGGSSCSSGDSGGDGGGGGCGGCGGGD